MSRVAAERVISLPNLAGGYTLSLSPGVGNTLVIRLIQDDVPSWDTTSDAASDASSVYNGDVNANDSFDSGYAGWTHNNSYYNRNELNHVNNGYYSTPIRKKSKADYADLQEGDRVLSINGKTVRNAARDVAMAYIDDADDTLDLEIARTRNANPRYQEQQTNQDIPTSLTRRTSSGSLTGNSTVRKVTTTTTRIKTTKDGERLQETVTKTVMESLDGETPTTVSSTQSERGELVGPVKKQGGGTIIEHTAPIKVDHGRRSSDVKITTPRSSTTERPRVSSNVTVGQPATISFQDPSKPPGARPGVWQPPQRQPAPQKQPIYQQPQTRYQQPQQQQAPQQQKARPRFDMTKPADHPRNTGPGPKADFAIQYGKPEPVRMRKPLAEKQQQPAYEPMSIMQKGDKGGSVGRELTITFAMPDQNTKVDFGSPPLSPSGMSVDSGVPPESPMGHKKHIDDEDDEEEDANSVFRDPSIILRSLAKDQPAPERLMRPFSEPAGRVTEEPEVSIVEKRRACKTIADLLMFPKNKQAKGARMFAKRRKRSARYTIEAIGQRDSGEDSEGSSGPDLPAAIVTIKSTPPPPPPPMPMSKGIPAPPPPPPSGFTQRIRVEPTNFNVKLKSKQKCEHNVVTPKQCMLLADGLKSASGRAAEMFEKRRIRSEQFVLEEDTKSKKPPTTFKKPPGPHSAAAAAASTTATINIKPKKLTPWEAAAESPVGSVTRAFPKEVKPPPPSTEPKPKPPAAWMKTSNMTPTIPAKPPAEPRIKPGFKAPRDLPKYPTQQVGESIPLKPGAALPKANFKDFNTKPRGWGSRSSGENTPGSPASVNSDQAVNGRGQIPTRPLKYSGGYNDFNPKPRAFGMDSPRHGALSPTSSLAESEDL